MGIGMFNHHRRVQAEKAQEQKWEEVLNKIVHLGEKKDEVEVVEEQKPKRRAKKDVTDDHVD